MPTAQRITVTAVLDNPGTDARSGGASPFVKWAGGKGQLLPELRKHVPERFGTYLEPFVGGGALFFALQPAKAVLNDTNEDLMNAYRVVQQAVEPLIALLSTYPYDREFYYDLRAQDPTALSPLERAARFLYLNRCCFNGLYRVNKRNEFNVPFGRFANPLICDTVKLRRASEALQHAILECMPYNELLGIHAKPGDFVYIDPPYAPVGKFSDFTRYTKEQFRDADQMALRDRIADLKRNGVRVIASNSHSAAALELYKGFEIHVVNVKRSINTRGGSRQILHEIIIL